MVEVRSRQPVAPDDVDTLRALADAAEAADGHPPFGEAVWQNLANPAQTLALFIAEEADHAIGALHLTARGHRAVTAAVVVLPEHRGHGVANALVDAALAAIAQAGGAHLLLWSFGADARAEAFATSTGFRSERELWQMRVPLPIDEQVRWPAGVSVRSFVPGQDEAEWLAVNNRAFANDPDQREWTEEHIHQRERESWFDPAGFLLATDDRGIAGFCWTKVHPARPPHEPERLGEIYVIGVDPDRQGTGLGRALVVAGLESLHQRGISTGMLFVDASNAAAIGLYKALGFNVSRVDRAFGRNVDAAS